jgi:hypothetical protein
VNPRLIRSFVPFDRQIGAKPLVQNAVGAFCRTCLKATDSENLVEESRGDHNWARVLVRCHGAEELGHFEFGSKDWTYELDLKRAMQRRAWFNPFAHNEAVDLQNQGVINDPGDHDP